MKSRSLLLLLPAAALLAAAIPAAAGQREVALVVDTSRSMVDNDPRRYTSILAQVIGDLLADGEAVTLVRMPPDGGGGLLSILLGVQNQLPSCDDGPNPQLAIQLQGDRRDWFKQQADRLLGYDTGTYFAAPIRTALQALRRSSAADKLLLVIADSGGLGDCDAVLTGELEQAARAGVKIAAINLGLEASAFASNPAFELSESATDADGLARAVATVYQRLLGVKKIQTGKVIGGRLRFEVEPHVREAHLVVLADGEVGDLRPAAGAPSAALLDLDFRGGGQAVGLDGRRRTYRMVHLTRPAGGAWEFELPGQSGQAGWLLIQDSAVGLRQVAPGPLFVGEDALLEVELYDQDTGERLQGAAARTFSSLAVELGGRQVPLRDDGQDGDRAAGDGVFSVRIASPQKGDVWRVRGTGDFLERELTLRPQVEEGPRTVEPPPPPAEALVPPPVAAEPAPEGPPPAAAEGKLDGTAPAPLDLAPPPPARPGADAQSAAVAPPATVVVPKPWLVSWWPFLAMGLVGLAGALVVHGFWAPSRFPSRMGLQISPEQDLGEGFFHPFRAQRGSGSGFHRDARLYLQPDFRLAARSGGALARLRAEGRKICLQPLGEVWRLGGDGAWELLAGEEKVLRVGTLHRNGQSTLFFELRNGSA